MCQGGSRLPYLEFANMVKEHVGLQPGETDAFRKEHSRLPGLPEEKSLALGLVLPEMPHGHICLYVIWAKECHLNDLR